MTKKNIRVDCSHCLHATMDRICVSRKEKGRGPTVSGKRSHKKPMGRISFRLSEFAKWGRDNGDQIFTLEHSHQQ